VLDQIPRQEVANIALVIDDENVWRRVHAPN
jgi:hypothetical protein